MKLSSVSLEQVLDARERRVYIQNEMLSGAGRDKCLVCLTLNIAGDIKRTPMTRMLFDSGVESLESMGLEIEDRYMLDELTGTEGFWLVAEDAARVKQQTEEIEDSHPAARLFDFDVLTEGGGKLSRRISRRCLICDAPASECARSRRHGLPAIREATDRLLRQFCADRLARAAYDSLLDELCTTPKPGLVDMMSSGAHTDMDVPLFEKSALSLVPYFRDAVLLGMNGCSMADLRPRGIEAERAMFEETRGVNTHKGMVYSMGLLLAGMGRCLVEGGECIEYASALARQDAEEQLEKSRTSPATNGAKVYRTYGVKGATGEASEGFPDAVYCLDRLKHYRDAGLDEAPVLAFCDSMARLNDTNILHRGGAEGLEFAKKAAAEICALPETDRIAALAALDAEMTSRNLSPGGSADMLALAFLLERWQNMSRELSGE